jgi:hypothetical protein
MIFRQVKFCLRGIIGVEWDFLRWLPIVAEVIRKEPLDEQRGDSEPFR